MKDIQDTRYLPNAEVRVVRENGAPVKIVGYAAVYGVPSEDLGGFREIIRKGAFKRAISGKPDVRALYNHDPNKVLGRTTSGTLRLSSDDTGLRYEIDPPESATREIESIERGDVSGSSFSFRIAIDGDKWSKDRDGDGAVREVRDVEVVYDVGPVTFPAYPDTTAAMRSLENHQKEERDAASRRDLMRRKARRVVLDNAENVC